MKTVLTTLMVALVCVLALSGAVSAQINDASDGRLNADNHFGYALLYCVDGTGATNTGTYAGGGFQIYLYDGPVVGTIFFATEAEINAAFDLLAQYNAAVEDTIAAAAQAAAEAVANGEEPPPVPERDNILIEDLPEDFPRTVDVMVPVMQPGVELEEGVEPEMEQVGTIQAQDGGRMLIRSENRYDFYLLPDGRFQLDGYNNENEFFGFAWRGCEQVQKLFSYRP